MGYKFQRWEREPILLAEMTRTLSLCLPETVDPGKDTEPGSLQLRPGFHPQKRRGQYEEFEY